MGKASRTKWEARLQDLQKSVAQISNRSQSTPSGQKATTWWLSIFISFSLGYLVTDPTMAIAFFLVTAIIAVVWVCLSFNNIKYVWPVRIICIIVIMIVFGLATKRTISQNEVRELALLYGPLLPASDPMPQFPSSCRNVPTGSMAIFLGSSVAFSREYPYTIIDISGRPVLTVNKDDRGIQVNLEIWDSEDKIIVEVQNNNFSINQGNYYKRERDWNSLSVYDSHKERVLFVKYLNPSALRILGTFRYQGKKLVIDDDKWQHEKGIIQGYCSHDNAGAAISLGGKSSSGIRIN
jgi:hypothetical protein